jgi:hypothetical protein
MARGGRSLSAKSGADSDVKPAAAPI